MPTAKYHSIYQSLRSAIENGEYPLQQKLPSEHTLIEKYNCSRNTVRRAIRQLAERMTGGSVLISSTGRSELSSVLLPYEATACLKA